MRFSGNTHAVDVLVIRLRNAHTHCAPSLAIFTHSFLATISFVFVCVCVDCFMYFLLIFVTFENIELQNIAVCFDALFHLSLLLKIKDDLVRPVCIEFCFLIC